MAIRLKVGDCLVLSEIVRRTGWTLNDFMNTFGIHTDRHNVSCVSCISRPLPPPTWCMGPVVTKLCWILKWIAELVRCRTTRCNITCKAAWDWVSSVHKSQCYRIRVQLLTKVRTLTLWPSLLPMIDRENREKITSSNLDYLNYRTPLRFQAFVVLSLSKLEQIFLCLFFCVSGACVILFLRFRLSLSDYQYNRLLGQTEMTSYMPTAN